MPSTTEAPAISQRDCDAAISTQDWAGLRMVCNVRPSSHLTRTKTSVMVNCSPTISMHRPASPLGPASIHRRSTREYGQLLDHRLAQFPDAIRQLAFVDSTKSDILE